MPSGLQFKFDLIDAKILEELQFNGKISMTSLAALTGLGEKACRARVQSLEQVGVIASYSANVNLHSFGSYLDVIIRVELDQATPRTRKKFEELIDEMTAVQNCHLLANRADYLLHALVRDSDALRHLVVDILSTVQGARIVSTDIALQTVKRGQVVPVRDLFGAEISDAAREID